MAEHRNNLANLRSRLERLADHSSGLLDLGSALVEQAERREEQDCVALQDDLPDYVESELNGQPARRLYPEIARHLDLCPDCAEIYLALVEMALETEEAPLPLPGEAPALDLSFLPTTTVAEQVRELVESMTRELLRRLEPESVPNLPAAGQVFFQRIAESHVEYHVKRGPALALAFGPDLPPALQSTAAVYTATLDLIHQFSADELDKELSSARPSAVLQRRARAAARGMGMTRSEASRWAELYVAQARTQAHALMDLARQVAKEERSD
jgi:hypothetical protein